MHYSISEMLNFQMFSIPLVGSDICGYLGEFDCVKIMLYSNHSVEGAAKALLVY